MKRVISLFLCICMLTALSSTRFSYAAQNKDSESKISISSPIKPVKNFFKRVNDKVMEKICKQIDKVDADTEKEINEKLKPIVDKMAGFRYDPVKDIYYTREDSLQKYFGFGDLYDKLGRAFGMKIDELPIVFRYKQKNAPEKEWLIEIWKGLYGGGLSTGGEIGIYNRLVEDGMKEYVPGDCNYKIFFDSAKGNEKMHLHYDLFDEKGKIIFRRDSSDYEKPFGEPQDKDWWLLGMKLGKHCRSEKLTMICKIKFLSVEMAESFAKAVKEQFPETIKNLKVKKQMVTLTWDK